MKHVSVGSHSHRKGRCKMPVPLLNFYIQVLESAFICLSHICIWFFSCFYIYFLRGGYSKSMSLLSFSSEVNSYSTKRQNWFPWKLSVLYTDSSVGFNILKRQKKWLERMPQLRSEVIPAVTVLLPQFVQPNRDRRNRTPW